jgi:hypothetical protein
VRIISGDGGTVKLELSAKDYPLLLEVEGDR